MRFLMIGISIVIGIILVGVVFSVTTDLTQPKEVEKVISFEILTDNVTVGTYEKFNQYGNQFPLVLVDILVNDISIGSPLNGNIKYDVYNIIRITELDIVDGVLIEITEDDEYYLENYILNDNDIVTVVFLVNEPQITSTSAILIALVPILFATGVILYAYNTSLRGREE